MCISHLISLVLGNWGGTSRLCKFAQAIQSVWTCPPCSESRGFVLLLLKPLFISSHMPFCYLLPWGYNITLNGVLSISENVMVEEFCLRSSVECCFLVGDCYSIPLVTVRTLNVSQSPWWDREGLVEDARWLGGACDRAVGTLVPLLALFCVHVVNRSPLPHASFMLCCAVNRTGPNGLRLKSLTSWIKMNFPPLEPIVSEGLSLNRASTHPFRNVLIYSIGFLRPNKIE